MPSRPKTERSREISRRTNAMEKEASKKDAAIDKIRDLILIGDFPPGERLTEEAIEHATGLTRTPIRQALARLASEGLVVIEPRQETRVRSVNPSEARQVLGLRFVVERLVVAELAELVKRRAVDPAPLLIIHKVMVRLQKQAERGELSNQEKCEFVKNDIAFHAKMAELARYQPAIGFLANLNSCLRLFAITSLQKTEVMQEVINEHQAIFKAINTGNARAARAAVQTHLQSAAQRCFPYHMDYVTNEVPILMDLATQR